MWVKMGEELELEGPPKGCIPPPPSPDCESTLSTIGTKNESLKRPLSPTPESHGNCDTFSPVVSYSPALDSNCSSAFAPVTCNGDDNGRLSQTEDSILTTLRRTHPDKVRRLEKKMRQPCKPELFKEHFDVLKTLLVRVANDCEQIRIILNYVEDKLVEEDKCVKRVQFTTL
nr:uncharacterized protein LOC117686840 [Crassostrea gigas]